jgi:hypothetical protein
LGFFLLLLFRDGATITFGGKFHVTPFPPWDDNVERTEAFKFALQRSCAHSGTSGHIPAMRVYAAHYAAGEKRAILMRNSLDRRIGHGSKSFPFQRAKNGKNAPILHFGDGRLYEKPANRNV